MKSARGLVVGILIIALLVALSTLLIPMSSNYDSWLLFHVPLATTISYAVLHMGAALLFLLSLSAYKAKLRQAFISISIGIVALALGTLQVAVIAAFDWWNTAWAKDGYIIIPFLLAAFVVYGGTRTLAKLVGTKTMLVKGLLVLPGVLALSFVSLFFPHVASSTPEVQIRASNLFLTWTVLMYFVCALITVAVSRQIGDHYKKAMGWLAAGFLVSCFVLVLAIIHSLLFPGSTTQDAGDVVVDVVGLFAGLAYLRAGYEFAKTREL